MKYRLAGRRCDGNVGLLVDQNFDCLPPTGEYGCVQRCHPDVVLGIDVCTALDQKFHRLQASVERRHMQRCSAESVPAVDVGAGVELRPDLVEVPLDRRLGYCRFRDGRCFAYDLFFRGFFDGAVAG